MASQTSMRTPDGQWLVEVYRPVQSTQHWYRLRNGDTVVDHLTITSVQRLLADAGYELADLQEAT